MSKNGIRNLITVLFCGAEGLHYFIPAIPLGIATTLGLVVRAVLDAVWPAVPANDASVTTPLAK